MMLRKRNMIAQRDQSSTRKASLFGVPRLFVGFGGKSSSDSDPAKSPTSPLDYKLFNLANPFARSPRVDSPRRSWECDHLKLGLTDALLERSNSSGILLGNQIRINISSSKITPIPPPKFTKATEQDLPYLEFGSSKLLLGAAGDRLESGELGKLRSCFSDVGQLALPSKEFVFRGSKSSEVLMVESVIRDVTPGKLMESLSASEIEESEDYTRITIHGPNPKTTHIFGDCILDCDPRELPNLGGKVSGVEPSSWFIVRYPEEVAMPSLAHDFLNFCYSCKKKLGEGDDIYMYRGEKAFCSYECREEVISAEEREAKAENNSSRHPMFSHNEEAFYKDMAESVTWNSK